MDLTKHVVLSISGLLLSYGSLLWNQFDNVDINFVGNQATGDRQPEETRDERDPNPD